MASGAPGAAAWHPHPEDATGVSLGPPASGLAQGNAARAKGDTFLDVDVSLRRASQ